MELSPNADHVTMWSLATHLVGRLEELIPEYNELDDNDRFKDYLNGLISAYEAVLIGIGYPINKIPLYEDN
jgi:hypothetical protein